MTVIGADRPGLVDSVAQTVADHGGNWLESRMSRLGGQFAGILRVTLPAEQREPLMTALGALEGRGLRVVVHEDATQASAAGAVQRLEVVGHDRPGIVRQIARTLAALGVNVEELSSEVASAPMSGEPLFKAHATLRLPGGCTAAALQRELERIAADLIVEITLLQPE